MKHSKILLGLIIKQLSINKTHLNTYNHTNEIHIHWTLDMCVVCGNRVWISPLSSMKLQWWIQSSHTQIAQSQVTYLTSRNERVWLLTKVFPSIEGFSFGFHFSYFMINTTQFLSNDAVKFFIFLWGISLWLWDHTFWIRFAPPFPSQISFWNKTFSTLSLSRDWCLKSLFF